MNALRDWIAEGQLNVLVVDDVETNLSLLSRLVSRLGHKVVLARDGAEAIARFTECAPDLILMDIRMPSMDGFETTARIRALQGSRWVPVIYVTAHDLEGGVVQAIESGGDDYLTKPVSAELLRAKLRAAARALVLERENERQRAALERYYHDAEEEQKVASHLMRRLVQTDMLYDRAVAHRITPASHLSGDLIAVARTPGNTLHVLLADGTGHGLAASLGVLPVVQPFYAMTERGFGLPAIAREMNRKVRDWLPVGRFVAATLIAVDARDGLACVWNAGNPPVVMLSANGDVLHRFHSRHLPLGIADELDFDDSLDRIALHSGAQIIACSDGVIEVDDGAGVHLGLERLIGAAAAAPCGRRMASINAALDQHLASSSAPDDIALILIDCDAVADTSKQEASADRTTSLPGLASWHFRVAATPEALRTTDVVARFTGTMERMGIAEHHRTNLFVILSELFNNALDHGLLTLDSAVKSGENGMERYRDLRAERLQRLAHGMIELDLEIEASVHKRARIRVRDSGGGFDWRRQLAVDECSAHGRGILLVRKLCCSLEYLGCGNEAVAHYELQA